MNILYSRIALLVIALLCLASRHQEASAQDLQNLQPTHGRYSYVSVEGVRTLKRGEWNLSSYMHYGRDPLLLIKNGEVDEVLVRYITTFEVNGAVSLHDRLELGITVPYSFTSGVSSAYPVDDAQGLGDLRLNPKLVLVQPEEVEGVARGFGLAVNAMMNLPTGNLARELEDDRAFVRRHFLGHLNLTMEYLFTQLRVALNVGYRLRPTRGEGFENLTDLDVSSGPTWGAALGYRLKQDVEINLEAFQRFMTYERAPMEGLLSVRSTSEGSINPMFGIGAGLGGDFSSVGLRVIGGLTWTPREENSGFQITDTDKDGIIDIMDRCPREPEDMDGQQDHDGCPEDDADRDGVLDAQDRCPDQREDRDGFEDTDGCPDLDNDKDGFLDNVDRCPLKPETVNQFEDHDGCPDEPVAPPPEEGEVIGLSEKIFFKHNESIILKRSYPILAQVAALLKRYPKITLVRIEGHTDDTGGRDFNLNLSQQRAEAVKLHLVGLGIEMQRMRAVGYGDERPIASNDTEEGKALNRRVDFRILSGPQEIFKVDTTPPKTRTAPPKTKTPVKVASPNPPTSAVGAERTYAVQVKASYRLSDAEKVRDALMKERFPAYVLSVNQDNGQVVHRVRVGPYPSRVAAQSALDSYQSRFPEDQGGYIVKISKSEAKKYR